MEKYAMFIDRKNQYSENEYTTQSNLQIQCNPYQATSGIFHISCLSIASFSIIFSHSEGCLFTLLIVSFVVLLLLLLRRFSRV